MKYIIRKMGAGYMHYIELPTKEAVKLTSTGNKRVICLLNKTITLHAAVMRTKEGMHYIMIAEKYLKQLGLRIGNTVDALIKKDTTELQFNIPEEFTEVFKTDPEAAIIFKKLTDGNKRGLISLVNMVKSTDKKIERALKIAEKLKHGITSPQKIIK
jgi:uncharacterized protein YdeI (YjbR/CyaY-like superfamily)